MSRDCVIYVVKEPLNRFNWFFVKNGSKEPIRGNELELDFTENAARNLEVTSEAADVLHDGTVRVL